MQALIIDESKKMVPDTKNRLEQTADELRSLIVSWQHDIILQCSQLTASRLAVWHPRRRTRSPSAKG